MTDRPLLAALRDVATLPLPAFDTEAAEAARARQLELTKPPGSLGRLEELAEFLAGWRGQSRPAIERAQAQRRRDGGPTRGVGSFMRAFARSAKLLNFCIVSLHWFCVRHLVMTGSNGAQRTSEVRDVDREAGTSVPDPG